MKRFLAAPRNVAQRVVSMSRRPKHTEDWSAYAVSSYGGKRNAKRNTVRFHDGSAVCFTSDGLPMEYLGA